MISYFISSLFTVIRAKALPVIRQGVSGAWVKSCCCLRTRHRNWWKHPLQRGQSQQAGVNQWPERDQGGHLHLLLKTLFTLVIIRTPCVTPSLSPCPSAPVTGWDFHRTFPSAAHKHSICLILTNSVIYCWTTWTRPQSTLIHHFQVNMSSVRGHYMLP